MVVAGALGGRPDHLWFLALLAQSARRPAHRGERTIEGPSYRQRVNQPRVGIDVEGEAT